MPPLHLLRLAAAQAAAASCCRQRLRRRFAGFARSSTSSSSPLILGIETSCDDTAAAVVSLDGRILGEAASSQAAVHASYGGVVPRLAAAAHAAAIDATVLAALRNAHVEPRQLAAVAVTLGPGLAMCLRVGVAAARKLASAHSLPLIYVHHMEAHALVARLCGGGVDGAVRFPYVALLVSGGHTLFVLVHGVGKHTLLGGTLDDALGEALDKTARLLQLDAGTSGGAALEALAAAGDPKRFAFGVPLRASPLHADSCELSFAGLKTAARLRIAAELGGGEDLAPGAAFEPGSERARARADLAAAFQAAAFKHLCERCSRALGWAKEAAPGVGTLVLSGGVARNAALRAAMAKVAARSGVGLFCPPPALCSDNGAMVAWAGAERFALGLISPPPIIGPIDADGIEHVEGLRPRWDMGERHPRSEAALEGARSLRVSRLAPTLTAAAV